MLDYSDIDAMKDQLHTLLVQLKTGSIDGIEYGVPCQPTAAFLRIRYALTAGGEQFQVKQVTRGMEGSGYYTPVLNEALHASMNRVLRFHHAGISEKLAALRRRYREAAQADVYTFYPVREVHSAPGRTCLIGKDPLDHGDTTTVTLSLD